MLTLTTRQQLTISLGLMALMFMTRGHHFASAIHLPEASWAVFFLAGFYVRQSALFAVLLIETVLLDFAAVTFGGVSNFCISPAYVFLIPTYGSLWFAGHWFARQYQFNWRSIFPFITVLLVGAILGELFSSGGFYFFSGRFADTSLAEFGARFVKYFPHNVQSLAFYTGIALVIHILLRQAKNRHAQTTR